MAPSLRSLGQNWSQIPKKNKKASRKNFDAVTISAVIDARKLPFGESWREFDLLLLEFVDQANRYTKIPTGIWQLAKKSDARRWQSSC
jgi:hypothetical protein